MAECVDITIETCLGPQLCAALKDFSKALDKEKFNGLSGIILHAALKEFIGEVHDAVHIRNVENGIQLNAMHIDSKP